jgi:hypothetical protein
MAKKSSGMAKKSSGMVKKSSGMRNRIFAYNSNIDNYCLIGACQEEKTYFY